MPKGNSGIRRSRASRVLDKSQYASPKIYESTQVYSEEYVKDPNGTLRHRETGERYALREKYAENPGFKEIRRAPVGSMIVVHQPATEWVRVGRIPAHDEYYEVVQRTRTIKSLELRHTLNPRGYYLWEYGVLKVDRFGEGSGGDISSVAKLQERFKYADRITIYMPK